MGAADFVGVGATDFVGVGTGFGVGVAVAVGVGVGAATMSGEGSEAGELATSALAAALPGPTLAGALLRTELAALVGLLVELTSALDAASADEG